MTTILRNPPTRQNNDSSRELRADDQGEIPSTTSQSNVSNGDIQSILQSIQELQQFKREVTQYLDTIARETGIAVPTFINNANNEQNGYDESSDNDEHDSSSIHGSNSCSSVSTAIEKIVLGTQTTTICHNDVNDHREIGNMSNATIVFENLNDDISDSISCNERSIEMETHVAENYGANNRNTIACVTVNNVVVLGNDEDDSPQESIGRDVIYGCVDTMNSNMATTENEAIIASDNNNNYRNSSEISFGNQEDDNPDGDIDPSVINGCINIMNGDMTTAETKAIIASDNNDYCKNGPEISFGNQEDECYHHASLIKIPHRHETNTQSTDDHSFAKSELVEIIASDNDYAVKSFLFEDSSHRLLFMDAVHICRGRYYKVTCWDRIYAIIILGVQFMSYYFLAMLIISQGEIARKGWENPTLEIPSQFCYRCPDYFNCSSAGDAYLASITDRFYNDLSESPITVNDLLGLLQCSDPDELLSASHEYRLYYLHYSIGLLLLVGFLLPDFLGAYVLFKCKGWRTKLASLIMTAKAFVAISVSMLGVFLVAEIGYFESFFFIVGTYFIHELDEKSGLFRSVLHRFNRRYCCLEVQFWVFMISASVLYYYLCPNLAIISGTET